MESRIKKRDATISYMRILAMIMVFGTHLKLEFDHGEIVDIIFRYGHLFVATFVVLSGYLNMNSVKVHGTKAFFLKKIGNLLVLYYAVVVIDLLYICAIEKTKTFDIEVLLRYLTCSQMLFPSTDFYYYNNLFALWTMTLFVFCYSVTPVLFRMAERIKKEYRCYILFFLSVIMYFAGMVGRRTLYLVLYSNPNISEPMQFSVWFPVNLIYMYGFGIFAYYSKIDKKENVACIMSFAAAIMTMIFMRGVDFFVVSLLTSGVYLIGSGVSLKLPYNTVVKLLDGMSFPIYLIHPLVIHVVKRYFGSGKWCALVAIASTILLSGVLDYIVGALKSRISIGVTKP